MALSLKISDVQFFLIDVVHPFLVFKINGEMAYTPGDAKSVLTDHDIYPVLPDTVWEPRLAPVHVPNDKRIDSGWKDHQLRSCIVSKELTAAWRRFIFIMALEHPTDDDLAEVQMVEYLPV